MTFAPKDSAMAAVPSELCESTTKTWPASPREPRQRGRLRASFRTGMITVIGSADSEITAEDTCGCGLVAVTFVPVVGKSCVYVSRNPGVMNRGEPGLLFASESKPSHRFCSHHRCRTNRDHGRDQDVSPLRKRFHTTQAASGSTE